MRINPLRTLFNWSIWHFSFGLHAACISCCDGVTQFVSPSLSFRILLSWNTPQTTTSCLLLRMVPFPESSNAYAAIKNIITISVLTWRSSLTQAPLRMTTKMSKLSSKRRLDEQRILIKQQKLVGVSLLTFRHEYTLAAAFWPNGTVHKLWGKIHLCMYKLHNHDLWLCK